jgi:hypothetical protein
LLFEAGGVFRSRIRAMLKDYQLLTEDLIVPIARNIELALQSLAISSAMIRAELRRIRVETEYPWNDSIQFSSYYTKVISANKWHHLLVLAHPPEHDSRASREDGLCQYIEDSTTEHIIDELKDKGAVSARASVTEAGLPAEGLLTLCPEIPGFEIVPAEIKVRWKRAGRIVSHFYFRPSSGVPQDAIRGRVTAFYSALLVADLPLTHTFGSDRDVAFSEQFSGGRPSKPYRKIFASYSHKDGLLVEQVRAFGELLGDRYLQDVIALRSGEIWSQRLREMIRDADVFQLFWSRHSMYSEFVRKEWEYALSLGRPHFVRPKFWETPLPSDEQKGLPPENLKRIHFQKIPSIIRPLVTWWHRKR